MDMDYALYGKVAGETVSYPLHPGRNTLGRQLQADVTLDLEGISRSHAAIDVDSKKIRIVDLHSKNGTFVNGARVQQQTLHVGDTVSLGPLTFLLDNGLLDNGVACHTATIETYSQFATAEPGFFQAPDSLEETPRTVDGRSRLFNTLVEFGAFLVGGDDDADIYCLCLKQVARLFKFRRACLVVLSDGGTPEIRSCYPISPTLDELDVSRTMIDTVVREHRSLLVRNSRDQYESAVFNGILSAVVVPLFDGQEVFGVLYIDHDKEHAFDERHVQRLQLMGNLVATKISQTATQKEMRGAAYIQASMLCKVPAQPPGVQVAFRLEPSAAVGGDLYETLALTDGRYLYALGDVSGHQFDAALTMANVMATMRALAPLAQSPLQLAEDIQRLVSGHLPQNGFVTLFLGFYDPQTQQFDYVNAGHDPPVLFFPEVAGAAAVQLDATGPPLGMQIPVPLEAARVELPAGALLCAWSDGIVEAARPGMHSEQFSRERLMQLLIELRERPVKDIVDRVFSELKQFLGDTHIRDDCTMLVLRRS